jgi:hypothetical protein
MLATTPSWDGWMLAAEGNRLLALLIGERGEKNH